MRSASALKRVIIALLGGGVLGLSLSGCGIFGPKSDSKPDYVGIWMDENRTAFTDRRPITVDFYLVLTENRASTWEHVQEGDTGCRTAGADILDYDAQAHKLTVAPDSGDVRVKHYVERQGDQMIFSEHYIFYALGRSDTLALSKQDPAELSACRDTL